MATPSERDLTHPVTAFVCATRLRLDTLVNAPTWSMDGAAVAAALSDLATMTAQLVSLESGVITQAETLALPSAAGCRTTTQFLAMTTHITTSAASRKTKLAKALTAHPDTAAALARGALHAEQASAITGAVDTLENLDHIEKTAIEQHYLDLAGDHDAQQLTQVGLRSLEVLDPVRADELESQALERQEARARKKARFSLYDDGAGLSHGSFTMPTAQASMLRKALIALGTPKHVRGTKGAGTYDHQTPTHRSSATPEKQVSSPPGWTPAPARSSPWAASIACTNPTSASPWSSNATTANTPAARPPPGSATSITPPPGQPAVTPTPTPPSLSSPSTTIKPTPPAPPTRCGPRPDLGRL